MINVVAILHRNKTEIQLFINISQVQFPTHEQEV